jgi:hypothetical protein
MLKMAVQGDDGLWAYITVKEAELGTSCSTVDLQVGSCPCPCGYWGVSLMPTRSEVSISRHATSAGGLSTWGFLACMNMRKRESKSPFSKEQRA